MRQTSIIRNTCLAATLLLAACTQDELAGDGTQLPEGKYPLEISSVSLSAEVDEQPWGTSRVPQTRVSENENGMSSKWDGGEVIKVRMSVSGKDWETTCTLGTSGNITAYDPQLYWQNTNDATINAWYSSIEGQPTVTENTGSLSDQSGGLAYVLKAEPLTANYQTKPENMKLTFKHQLAKVRVVLTGDKATVVNDVKVWSYTSCTHTMGNIKEKTTEGWITMKLCEYNDVGKCWEANVVPEYIISKMQVNGKEVTLTTSVTPVAAKMHKITLIVGELIVNVSEITDTEYEIKGNVHLKGDGQAKNLKLNVADGANLTLEDVKLQPQSDGPAITCKGEAKIILKGNNSVSGHGRAQGILVSGGKTLVIEGDGELEATGSGTVLTNAGIGATQSSNITINGGTITAKTTGECAGIGSAGCGLTCGVITINGGTIEAHGGIYSAGIGGSNSGSCGDIIITGGNIKAYGGSQTAGIGNGDTASCGNITISGASTVVYAKKGSGKNPASIGYNNYAGSCGKVTIGPECTVTQE